MMRGGDGAESRGILAPQLVTARKGCDSAFINLEEGWMGVVSEMGGIGEPGLQGVGVASNLFLEHENGRAALHGDWFMAGAVGGESNLASIKREGDQRRWCVFGGV